MNNKDFISELSRRVGYSMSDTQRLVNNVISAMGDSFQDDDAVQVPNFGIMVNPSTQQRMLVPPKLVLCFKPHAAWKERLKTSNR